MRIRKRDNVSTGWTWELHHALLLGRHGAVDVSNVERSVNKELRVAEPPKCSISALFCTCWAKDISAGPHMQMCVTRTCIRQALRAEVQLLCGFTEGSHLPK